MLYWYIGFDSQKFSGETTFCWKFGAYQRVTEANARIIWCKQNTGLWKLCDLLAYFYPIPV